MALPDLQIRTIDRVCEIPHEGPFCDLMWSDPEDIDTWAISPRGAGWLFGCNVTAEFNQINGEAGQGRLGLWQTQARSFMGLGRRVVLVGYLCWARNAQNNSEVGT